MDVTPLIPKGQQIIQGYANGEFKVSGKAYAHPVIISPQEIFLWEILDIKNVSNLSIEHFSPLVERASDIDVLLIGSGKDMAFLPPALRGQLKQKGLSADIMDTGAACRTYNVLMAEGRRVICALMLCQ